MNEMAGRESFTEANGLEICFERYGDPKDPAILLVMGLGAQMHAWPDALVRDLVEAGFQVIRFDNRDVGRSAKLDHLGVPNLTSLIFRHYRGKALDAPYLMGDMAADAIGLLDALEVDRAHVVGASLGGMIAQQMAIDSPDRLHTLTSIMSTTSDPSVPGGTLRAMYALLKRPSKKATLEELVETMMRKRMVIGGEGHVDDEETRAHTRAMLERSVYPEGVVRQNACVIASGSRTEALKSVTTPTLVLHGSKDPLVRIEGGLHTAKTIPGARLEILDGMGHALYPRYLGPIRDLIVAHARGEAASPLAAE